MNAEDTSLSARMLGAVLAFELAKDMVASGMWMLNPESVMERVARMSSSLEVFAYMWMALAILVLPYLFIQVTRYCREYEHTANRLACWAILGSGVCWAYLGYLSKNLDYGYMTEIFILHSITCLAMAAILGNGLNTAQRKRQEALL